MGASSPSHVSSAPVSVGHRGLRLHSAVLPIVRLLASLLCSAAPAHGLPHLHFIEPKDGPEDPGSPSLWIYLTTAVFLVLLGGAFAGLTIALMGQDEVYLQVIATSGEGIERKNATKVLTLLKKGKHWVLVTLLVANVITNETLPIVLDRSIGGGYLAAAVSTLLVIIFGEIVPQSICVRYGLGIGAWMSNFVLVLMWIFAPVTWPTAKLLDRLLGEDHGTTYKKAGLKTLVTLHKTMGPSEGDRLNQDEVTIISAVLDLKAKQVGHIMTPMNDVFTLPSDAILDEAMMDCIMNEGYSRIPIHKPGNRSDFLGMLLVKMLITYDPEDALKVSDFSLATLPETRPETSCLDIINFFQQGKSHMVLVSDFPGKSWGAMGVVTLEDVIEELIGEEIIDESDVFVDVHKAIRRLHPAPISHLHHHHGARDVNLDRVSTGEIITDPDGQHEADEDDMIRVRRNSETNGSDRPMAKRSSMTRSDHGGSPKTTTFMVRRNSNLSTGRPEKVPIQMKRGSEEFRQQLRNLGPSNAARQPRQTRIGTVTIKNPGVTTIPENRYLGPVSREQERPASVHVTEPPASDAQEGIGRSLLSNSGRDAKDGVQALTQGYGTLGSRSDGPNASNWLDSQADEGISPHGQPRRSSKSTIGSLPDSPPLDERATAWRGAARSGSITEQFVEAGGVKKLVLETTSSSEDGDSTPTSEPISKQASEQSISPQNTRSDGHKKRGRRKHKHNGSLGSNDSSKQGKTAPGDENVPLLSRRSP